MRKRWQSSLRLRVLLTTMVSTVVLLGLMGILLIRVSSSGIIEAKRKSAINEALGAQTFMQQRLRGDEFRSLAVSEALGRLAEQTGRQTTQFRLVIQAPTSTLVSSGLSADSVPAELSDRVANQDGLFMAPALVKYTLPSTEATPGLAIGTTLSTVSGDRIPVFYLFPMSSEQQVIQFISFAVLITFCILSAALTLIVYLAAWQAVGPIRKASSAALRLASGDLSERLPVERSDEIATLADSMNKMAEELQSRIRQLESLSAVQRRFVSDVSHELRTPLTTIKMAAELLYEQRSASDAATERSIELMHSEIERFEALLLGLLEISRFDAGAAVLLLEEQDFEKLVREEVASHESLAQSQGISFKIEVRKGDMKAAVDTRRIRRVLRNLLTNAIDHGAGKSVDITVASDDQTVAVSVRDHGVGFEPELSSRLFDRFWRADPSRTRIAGGTGLGLSIALEDTRLHRGTLSAWGRPGEGAQFRLTLPKGPEFTASLSPLPVAPAKAGGAQ